MLKKIFLGIVAIAFVTFGALVILMGYAFNNPDKIFNAMTSVTDRFLQGQDHQETEEFFLQGMEDLRLQSRDTPILIRNYDGSALKIELKGKIPRFESGPFIQSTLLNTSLAIQLLEPLSSGAFNLNINGDEYALNSADAKLEATVYLPNDYQGRVEVATAAANVNIEISGNRLYEFDIKSDNGEIKNSYQPQIKEEAVASPFKVQSLKGTISVQSR